MNHDALLPSLHSYGIQTFKTNAPTCLHRQTLIGRVYILYRNRQDFIYLAFCQDYTKHYLGFKRDLLREKSYMLLTRVKVTTPFNVKWRKALKQC